VPAERVAALRKALEAMLKDETFLGEANKQNLPLDPVTGEGLYYAIRSGDLASRVLLDDAIATADKPAEYRSALASEFTDDLRCASRMARRLYLGDFALGSMPDRLIQMSRRSALLRDVVQDLFAGVQPYTTLKSRLKSRFTGTMTEVLASFVQRRAEI
jgi:flavin-dependent dehydrogenase